MSVKGPKVPVLIVSVRYERIYCFEEEIYILPALLDLKHRVSEVRVMNTTMA